MAAVGIINGMQDDETRRAMTLPSPPAPLMTPARRLLRSRVGRALAPHWGALLALALFLIVGLAVLDDYGVTTDESPQRGIANSNLRYLANGDFNAFLKGFWTDSDKLYGVAFEAPLLWAERGFALEGSRAITLSRHLLTSLFFLVGGLFAYLLAKRLFGARLLSLTAMLILLLHPRLYAHSFFNSKDIPFVVAFIIALYLAHRAFRRDSVAAFSLLGVGVGIAVNLRIMGAVLLVAIPALRALDLAFAPSWRERKRALLATGAFALASLLTVYALLPYLWSDPLARAAEWWTMLSDHPTIVSGLFRGTLRASNELPADYVPTWFSITSPPFALALGLVGAGAVLCDAVRAPRAVVQNGSLRFGLLLVGCVAAPVAAVILLNANIYNGWKHMYFMWAPFALLAVVGLAALTRALERPRLRAAVYGAAGAGLAATLASMALIHPNQQVYFSFAVDRVAPEYLRTQYVMDNLRHPMRQAFEWLSDNANLPPDEAAATGGAYWAYDLNARILPEAERARLPDAVSFMRVWSSPWVSWSRSARALHRVQVYGNTILAIERKDDPQAVYDAARGREPDVAGAYDVHRLDDAVALVMEPCAPSFIERVGATLRVTPVDPGDLPPWREGKREEPRYFPLLEFGAFFDGKCVASLPLPDYPVADFRLDWGLLSREDARDAMRRAKENGRLLARSAYDVYLADGELVYVQEPCDPLDTERPFRVRVFPQRMDDLPDEWRERGHQQFWFEFYKHGALLEEGACVALFPLPDYPIAAARTRQYVEGGGDVWSAAFSANPEPYAAAYRAVEGSEPLARGAFDLRLLDGDLVYVKESCDQADTEARFFLHVIPERVSDLPAERRQLGWDNLDFPFFRNGAWFDARCAARVPLPDYPIASVRTGQFVSGVGEIWSAEFEIGR